MTNKEFRTRQAEACDKNSEHAERSAQQRAIDRLGKMTPKNLKNDNQKDTNWSDRVFKHKTPHVKRDNDGNIIGADNYYVDRDP